VTRVSRAGCSPGNIFLPNGARSARTPERTLGAGKRTVKLKLDPRKWPTGLSIKATAVSSSPGGGSDAGGGTITT
jgi:hypothetical protein